MESRMAGTIKNREFRKRIASIALPVIILIVTVVYLVLYISYNTPVMLHNDSFYNQALVSAGKSIEFNLLDVSMLYVYALHGMLLIFGNTPFAGLVLQIILFFVCLLLLYIGMQYFAGSMIAAVSMAVLAFSPLSLRYLFSITPEFFYLTFCLLGFMAAGAIFKKLKKSFHVKNKAAEASVSPASAPAPGEPLHNPLPVPKKKERRPRADFDHGVKEADMKFDVELAEGDDFEV